MNEKTATLQQSWIDMDTRGQGQGNTRDLVHVDSIQVTAHCGLNTLPVLQPGKLYHGHTRAQPASLPQPDSSQQGAALGKSEGTRAMSSETCKVVPVQYSCLCAHSFFNQQIQQHHPPHWVMLGTGLHHPIQP